MTTLNAIRKRLENATPGEWVYDPNLDTHDSCIYVKNSSPKPVGNYTPKYRNGPKDGGIVGSSEWIWIEDNDGEFIANAKSDITYLLNLITDLQQQLKALNEHVRPNKTRT